MLQGLQDPVLASEAATALQNISSQCRDNMAEHFTGLLQILEQIDKFNLKPEAANGLIKGVVMIISIMNQDQLKGAVEKVCILHQKLVGNGGMMWLDYKADPEVAAVKKESEAATAANTMITNNEGFREVQIETSPGKLPQDEAHHLVGKVPEEVWKDIGGIDDEAALPEAPHDDEGTLGGSGNISVLSKERKQYDGSRYYEGSLWVLRIHNRS